MTCSRVALTTSILGALALMSSPALAFADPSCPLPYPVTIRQSNGWAGYLDSPTSAWVCSEGQCIYGRGMHGQVTIQNLTRSDMRFLITWDNGSAGIYTGSVDENGFLSGQTQDRWHPDSKADWHMDELVNCGA